MPEPTDEARASTMSTVSIGDRLRRYAQVVLNPIAGALGRTGLTPNMLTVTGFLLNVGVAAILAQGYLLAGGALLLFAAGFDALDGTLARLTGKGSTFGAFFDSTVDRYSEAAVYGGVLYFQLAQDARTETLLVYAAIIGSLMVSYARARAEGLGIQCKVGIATRFERVFILSVGLISGWVTPALWLVAVLANLTAVHRMVHVWRAARKRSDGA